MGFVLQRILLLQILLLVCAGCGPSAEPVVAQPTPEQMYGKWTLVNSPKISTAPVIPVPGKGNSTILLASNRVANVSRVLVEEIFPDRKPWPYVTTLKTEVANWDVKEQQGHWSIVISFTNHQSIALPILQRRDSEFRLEYRPDPEGDAFIYVQEAVAR